MARLAGSDHFYRLGLSGSDGQVRSRLVQLTSVTTILSVVGKQLQNWGWRLGVEAALEHFIENGEFPVDLEECQDLLWKERINPKKALETAADRGTDVHDHAEKLLRAWVDGRKNYKMKKVKEAYEAALAELPEKHHGYITAAYKFVLTITNYEDFDILLIEEPLFSLEHRFAGTTDMVYTFKQNGRKYFHVGDWKTSGGIYDSHLLQGIAYKIAATEMDIVPDNSNVKGIVVRIGEDGNFETEISPFHDEDFLLVKELYERLKAVEKTRMKLRAIANRGRETA